MDEGGGDVAVGGDGAGGANGWQRQRGPVAADHNSPA